MANMMLVTQRMELAEECRSPVVTSQCPRRALRTILVLGFLCGVMGEARAQDAAGVYPWSFELGINGSYEGNALFVGPEENEEFAHQVRASLGRRWRPRGGDARLTADVSQSFYHESSSLNDFRYGLGGALTHALTPRLSWTGGSAVTSGLARDAEVLTDAGLVLPSVTTRTSYTSSAFRYALSPRGQISWSLSHTGIGFAPGLFTNGSLVTSVLSWSRQVTRSQTLGVTQDYTHTFSDVASASVLGFMGTWTRSAGRTWTASASAGVRPYTVPNEGGYRFAPAISVGLTKPVRAGQTVGITYDRTISQTLGFDWTNQLLQTVSANYGITLRRNLTTTFSGTYSRTSTPVAHEQLVTGETALALIGYRIASKLGVEFGASYYGRTIPSSERSTSYRMITSLTYGTTWR